MASEQGNAQSKRDDPERRRIELQQEEDLCNKRLEEIETEQSELDAGLRNLDAREKRLIQDLGHLYRNGNQPKNR